MGDTPGPGALGTVVISCHDVGDGHLSVLQHGLTALQCVVLAGLESESVSQLVLVGTGTAAAYNIGFTCTSPLTHHSLDTGLELWQIISLLVVFLHTLSEI